MKVAYNRCFGGFSLSHEAIMRLAELKGVKIYPFVNKCRFSDKDKYVPFTGGDADKEFIHYCTTPKFSNETYWSTFDQYEDRSDPALIQVIEELGDRANGSCAKLAIEDIPRGIRWRIEEYDGRETIMTESDYDWNIAT